jgi:hypothetical protein
LITALLVAIALVAGSACTVNPVTGKSQLDLIGEAREIELGKSLYPSSIQESLGPIEDGQVQGMVAEVGQKLAGVSHRPALPYEFTAVSDPEVNAFALPGGKICITRGLLARLESVDGMANVMGHEVGHVTARHAVGHYNRQILATAVTVGAMVYMGTSDSDYRGLIGIGAIVGTQLALAHYSREQERQSDDLGISRGQGGLLAARHDRDPEGAALASGEGTRSRAAPARLAPDVGGAPGHGGAAGRSAAAGNPRTAAAVARVPGRDARGDRAARGVGPGRRGTPPARCRKGQGGRGEARRGVAAGAGQGMIGRCTRCRSLADREARRSPGARRGTAGPEGVHSQSVGGQLLLKPDPAAALACFEQAEDPAGQADVALLRGRALEKLGRKQEAVEAYRQARERDPNGKVGSEASKRLQALGAT